MHLGIHFVLTLAACQNAPAPETKKDLAADTSAIDELRDQVPAALAVTYANDAIEMDPNEAAIEGIQSIQAAYTRPSSRRWRGKIAFSPLETQVAGDWAYERGNYTASMTPKSGKPMEVSYKYFVILKRQPDGAWKLYREISNNNNPPPNAGGKKK